MWELEIKNWCFHDKGGPLPAPVFPQHWHINWERIFLGMLRIHSVCLERFVCVCLGGRDGGREREHSSSGTHWPQWSVLNTTLRWCINPPPICHPLPQGLTVNSVLKQFVWFDVWLTWKDSSIATGPSLFIEELPCEFEQDTIWAKPSQLIGLNEEISRAV